MLFSAHRFLFPVRKEVFVLGEFFRLVPQLQQEEVADELRTAVPGIGKSWGNQPRSICDDCFSPLEVNYDYAAIQLTRDEIARRPPNMWRYAELLPLPANYHPNLPVGFTPLLSATHLAQKIGARRLCIKNDAVCLPTLSFKDRVVAVALAQARNFGLDTVACSSTGKFGERRGGASRARGLQGLDFHPGRP